MSIKSVIGEPVSRVEDLPLIRGRGRFIADLDFAHQLHMRIVRSSHAHGLIRSISTDAARAVLGVFAVWTADDIPDIGPIDFREGKIEKLEAYRQPVLARGRVRYVGEPIAAVFATDAYVAEDAADLVEVDIEPLPVMTDAFSTPGEFEAGLSTEASVFQRGFGDVDQAFAQAHTVVEMDLSTGRHSGVPMETRGAIGRYDPVGDVLELHGATKVPHKNQESLARVFNRSTTRLLLFEYHVGGGFGVRGEIYPEDILVLAAALRFDRPVKWIEDRREHFMAANQSRQQRHKIRAAVDENAILLGIECEFWHDQGAYPRTHAMRVAETTCNILLGPYLVPAYRITAHYRLTNKTPAATYRAPARFEANFVRERLFDLVATRMNLSRVEMRLRNLIPTQAMPYARPSSHDSIDSGDYRSLLKRSLEQFGWDRLEKEVAARKANGELVGIGLGAFVERSGLGPYDGAKVSIDEKGMVEVITGGASVGQGFETVMAQVCAEALGVNYKDIRVVHGQTNRIEHGIGAHASRATVMTANAVHVAATAVHAKALDVASELLQSDPESLTITQGVVSVRGGLGGSISLGEIAIQLRPASPGRNGRVPGLSSDGWFHAEEETYPYGNQLALVSIDRLTGKVTVEKMLVAYDIGRAINPMLVRGQIVGGFVQGLGGALFEEFRYSAEGEPLAVTFADYLVPTMAEVPDLEVILSEDSPSTRNPLGIKGAGESGIAAVGSVIASAVDDAIGLPGCVRELPLHPQVVWSLVRNADQILGRGSAKVQV